MSLDLQLRTEMRETAVPTAATHRLGQHSTLSTPKTMLISLIVREKKRSDSRWPEGSLYLLVSFQDPTRSPPSLRRPAPLAPQWWGASTELRRLLARSTATTTRIFLLLLLLLLLRLQPEAILRWRCRRSVQRSIACVIARCVPCSSVLWATVRSPLAR